LGPETVPLAGVATWAPVSYEGPARALVRGLKFRGAAAIAEAMAAQIAARVPPRLLEESTLAPVPLHPSRQRRRGFNQAERLARALAERTGLGLAACLDRSGPSRPQTGRPRADRVTAMRGAVTATRRPPPRVVLVDDVATTGATLAACAGALRAAGADRVVALAYARTPAR
jgi:ComF family protein